MRRLLLTVSFVTLIQCLGFSQDSLVYFNELVFKSDLEKATIKAYLDDRSPDYFALFSQVGPDCPATAPNNFKDFLNRLDNEKLSEKKADKKIKYLYEKIHGAYLSKYVSTATFPELFISGEYNCVSASALYALAFEHLNVPYIIKEKPTHVYLVAYPTTNQVIVETTNPKVGLYAFDQRFKASYLERLKDQKMISVAEFSQTDINQLFDKYFFQEESAISLKQLIGIQYMNDGIQKFEAGDYQKAVQQMEKAYLFYPEEKIANSLFAGYTRAFTTGSKRDQTQAVTLAKLSRFNRLGITVEMLQSDMYLAINDLLFSRGEVGNCKSFCETVLAHVKNKDINNELKFIYQYELGRYYYNKGSYLLAKPFFAEALTVKPNHQEAQGIYISLLERSVRLANNNKEVIELLKDADQKFPTLQSNNKYNALVAESYLSECATAFQENQVKEGEEFISLFEHHMKKFQDLDLNQYLIGQAYSTAAVYYFKKNQMGKAKAYIDRGLTFAPANIELRQRARMIR